MAERVPNGIGGKRRLEPAQDSRRRNRHIDEQAKASARSPPQQPPPTEPARSSTTAPGTTYSNYSVPDEDLQYLFIAPKIATRTSLVSNDDGSSWTTGGRLLTSPGRPYVRYASDGASRIHFIATHG
jgi:hypothetical protein